MWMGNPCLAAIEPDPNSSETYDLEDMEISEEQQGTAESGYRYDSAEVGPLGDTSLKDTPYSMMTTSGELIENRNAHNPTDALQTVPTVAPILSTGGYSSMSGLAVRGFSACDQSTLVDGMTDRSFTLPPIESVERVDVFNGMSGFLYGYSTLGGTVNYTTKKPLDDPYTSFSTGFYNKAIAYAHADLSGPIDGSDGRLAYRLNLYKEGGETYIEDSQQKRELASGALRYRLTEETTLKANFYSQYVEMDGLQTYFDMSALSEVPDAFDPTKQYGQDWTFNRVKKSVVDVGLEHQLADHLSFRGAYRYGRMWRDYCFVSAKLTDASGNYTETFVDSPGNDETITAGYALFDADFDTWEFKHNVTFGYTHWGFTFERGNSVADANSGAYVSSVSNPVAYDDDIVGTAYGYTKHLTRIVHNLLIGDRIELNPMWSVLLGANYSKYKDNYYGAYASAGTPSHRTYDELTPSAGVMFKPYSNMTVYASYMEGMEGGMAPATYNSTAVANAHEMLTSVSEQYELGIKTSLWDRLDVSAALFKIDKGNLYVDTSDYVYKQAGRQVHQGLELMTSGKLTENLTLIGGLTTMSAEVKKASDPNTEGHTPINVAEDQARVYLEYQLPSLFELPGQLTLSGGVNVYGKRPVDIPNTLYMPSATTFDLGLRYQPNDNLTLNLNVANLTDEHYWSHYLQYSDGAGTDGLVLGDPRRISLSAKYTF